MYDVQLANVNKAFFHVYRCPLGTPTNSCAKFVLTPYVGIMEQDFLKKFNCDYLRSQLITIICDYFQSQLITIIN